MNNQDVYTNPQAKVGGIFLLKTSSTAILFFRRRTIQPVVRCGLPAILKDKTLG